MSLDQQTPFEHEPLDHTGDSIRLLHLVPRKENQTIECQIWTRSLNTPTETQFSYSALSYVWGSPEEPRRWTSVNGKPFPILPNLYTALCAVDAFFERHPEVSRVLWVDALCIDQSNLNERNHQVGLMSRIYSEATHVLAWLGGSTTTSPAVFDWMSAIDDLSEIPPYTEEIGNGILELCKCEYWRRAWIQPEIFLARDAILICGNDNVRWHQWRSGCFSLDRTKGGLVWTWVAFLVLGLQKHKLAELIIRTNRSFECSDIRDRVFSLLSMASDIKDDEEKRKADYFISPELLFMGIMGVCEPENATRLATSLALMLEVRAVDLLRLVSDGPSGRDLAYTNTVSQDIGENISIWAVLGQQNITKMREWRSRNAVQPLRGISVLDWRTSGNTSQLVYFISGKEKSRVTSSIVTTEDFRYNICGTDVALVGHGSLFGMYVAGFLRKDSQSVWHDFVPAIVPGTENVKEAVLTVLKITRETKIERAMSAPDRVYGLEPPIRAALEPGRGSEHADVFLGVLELLRVEGQLCLRTCALVSAVLFNQSFEGPFGFSAESEGRETHAFN